MDERTPSGRDLYSEEKGLKKGERGLQESLHTEWGESKRTGECIGRTKNLWERIMGRNRAVVHLRPRRVAKNDPQRGRGREGLEVPSSIQDSERIFPRMRARLVNRIAP